MLVLCVGFMLWNILCRLSEAVVGEINVCFCAVYHKKHAAICIAVYSGIFVGTCRWDTYELCRIFLPADTSEILIRYGINTCYRVAVVNWIGFLSFHVTTRFLTGTQSPDYSEKQA